MKRLLVFCVVAAFVVAIPLSHSLMAQKADKVKLCHLTKTYLPTGIQDPCDPNYIPLVNYVGHVIEVAASAVPAHLAHGDYKFTSSQQYVIIGACCSWSKE